MRSPLHDLVARLAQNVSDLQEPQVTPDFNISQELLDNLTDDWGFGDHKAPQNNALIYGLNNCPNCYLLIGTFNSGKSSLLNCIVGIPLAKVETNEETAVLTEYFSDPRHFVRLVYTLRDVAALQKEIITKIAAACSEWAEVTSEEQPGDNVFLLNLNPSKENISGLASLSILFADSLLCPVKVQVFYPFSRIPRGSVFVDTPGNNGAKFHQKFLQVKKYFSSVPLKPEQKKVIYVHDLNSPTLSYDEWKILEELKSACVHRMFVGTCVDQYLNSKGNYDSLKKELNLTIETADGEKAESFTTFFGETMMYLTCLLPRSELHPKSNLHFARYTESESDYVQRNTLTDGMLAEWLSSTYLHQMHDNLSNILSTIKQERRTVDALQVEYTTWEHNFNQEMLDFLERLRAVVSARSKTELENYCLANPDIKAILQQHNRAESDKDFSIDPVIWEDMGQIFSAVLEGVLTEAIDPHAVLLNDELFNKPVQKRLFAKDHLLRLMPAKSVNTAALEDKFVLIQSIHEGTIKTLVSKESQHFSAHLKLQWESSVVPELATSTKKLAEHQFKLLLRKTLFHFPTYPFTTVMHWYSTYYRQNILQLCLAFHAELAHTS